MQANRQAPSSSYRYKNNFKQTFSHDGKIVQFLKYNRILKFHNLSYYIFQLNLLALSTRGKQQNRYIFFSSKLRVSLSNFPKLTFNSRKNIQLFILIKDALNFKLLFLHNNAMWKATSMQVSDSKSQLTYTSVIYTSNNRKNEFCLSPVFGSQ